MCGFPLKGPFIFNDGPTYLRVPRTCATSQSPPHRRHLERAPPPGGGGELNAAIFTISSWKADLAAAWRGRLPAGGRCADGLPPPSSEEKFVEGGGDTFAKSFGSFLFFSWCSVTSGAARGQIQSSRRSLALLEETTFRRT